MTFNLELYILCFCKIFEILSNSTLDCSVNLLLPQRKQVSINSVTQLYDCPEKSYKFFSKLFFFTISKSTRLFWNDFVKLSKASFVKITFLLPLYNNNFVSFIKTIWSLISWTVLLCCLIIYNCTISLYRHNTHKSVWIQLCSIDCFIKLTIICTWWLIRLMTNLYIRSKVVFNLSGLNN
jgi:hypothetical protein